MTDYRGWGEWFLGVLTGGKIMKIDNIFFYLCVLVQGYFD